MSYPLNFGIYCGMSKQFRDTAKQLIPIPCKSISNSRNNGGIMIVTNTKETGTHQRLKSESSLGAENKVPKSKKKSVVYDYISDHGNITI